MSTATKGHPSGSLRVSDADRDRAIAELSEHYQASASAPRNSRTAPAAPSRRAPPPT